MSNIVRFITTEALTDNMPINNDVDSDKLKKTIYIAQEQHIQNALGSNLYNKVKELVAAGTIGDAGNECYKDLLDNYIIKTLYRYSYYRAIRIFSSQFTDKGVQTRDGEASSRSDKGELHSLRQDALNDAEFHEKLMLKHICDKGSACYPEYFELNNEDIKPKTGHSFNGIVHSRQRPLTDQERIERYSK